MQLSIEESVWHTGLPQQGGMARLARSFEATTEEPTWESALLVRSQQGFQAEGPRFGFLDG